jgi:hypothetical protein
VPMCTDVQHEGSRRSPGEGQMSVFVPKTRLSLLDEPSEDRRGKNGLCVTPLT